MNCPTCLYPVADHWTLAYDAEEFQRWIDHESVCELTQDEVNDLIIKTSERELKMSEVEIDLGTSPEGHPVGDTSIKVLNMGDGLSKAMKVEPVLIKAGEEAYIIVKVIKTKDQYDYTFDDDDDVESVELVQVFRAKTALFVDDVFAVQAIARMEKMLAEAAKDPNQGSLERTCVTCGWTVGEEPRECEGSPLHDFPVAEEVAGETDENQE